MEAWEKLVETRLMVRGEMYMLYIQNPQVRFFKSFHQLYIKDALGQLQCCWPRMDVRGGVRVMRKNTCGKLVEPRLVVKGWSTIFIIPTNSSNQINQSIN